MGLFEVCGKVIALPSKADGKVRVGWVGGDARGGDADDGFGDGDAGHEFEMVLDTPFLSLELVTFSPSRACGQGANRDARHAVNITMPRFLQNFAVEGRDEVTVCVDFGIHAGDRGLIRSGALMRYCDLRQTRKRMLKCFVLCTCC